MNRLEFATSSHALLANLAANGVDRVFLVPGESYLGILDALHDFPQLDVVTCRHEAGAGFMALADARLSRRPGVVMVSRGPGASNVAIAIHTAQQDALPLIVLVGQVPWASLRREAFQEIDYQQMYGGIAKWVSEPRSPEQVVEVIFKALRIASADTPGAVVIVLPEDIQQQPVTGAALTLPQRATCVPSEASLEQLTALLSRAERPLIIAGGALEAPGGREALKDFAEAWNIPVVVSFRRHHLFPNRHALYAGDLGLKNPQDQMDAFYRSDLILALGTRLGDITTQGYRFPALPRPAQTLVHCHPDGRCIGLNFAADLGLTCDAVALAALMAARVAPGDGRASSAWARELRGIYEKIARWPEQRAAGTAMPIDFTEVVRVLSEKAPDNSIICLDAGAFGAPFYRHFPFDWARRLLAPISGAMGYGVPAAVAAQLREPRARVVCVVGDGGYMMTGNEMIAAVERSLPILFLLSNNAGYGSIRIHQDRTYPGRHAGTSLFNPDFTAIARAFGMEAERVESAAGIAPALSRGLQAEGPYFIEFRTVFGLAD